MSSIKPDMGPEDVKLALTALRSFEELTRSISSTSKPSVFKPIVNMMKRCTDTCMDTYEQAVKKEQAFQKTFSMIRKPSDEWISPLDDDGSQEEKVSSPVFKPTRRAVMPIRKEIHVPQNIHVTDDDVKTAIVTTENDMKRSIEAEKHNATWRYKGFMCNMCGFDSKTMEDHMDHDCDPEKPNVTCLCTRVFPSIKTKRIHVLKSRHKPFCGYACQRCNTRFTSRHGELYHKQHQVCLRQDQRKMETQRRMVQTNSIRSAQARSDRDMVDQVNDQVTSVIQNLGIVNPEVVNPEIVSPEETNTKRARKDKDPKTFKPRRSTRLKKRKVN